MRDVTNPILEGGAEERPISEVVTAPSVNGAGTFIAQDQWVSILPVVALPNQGYRPLPNIGVVLSMEGNRTLVVSEPFYVSGKRQFFFFETGDYLVMRASRRELLSENPTFDGGSTGPRQTEAASVSGAIGSLSAPTNWFYLDQNLSWVQGVIGDTGAQDPFGFGAGVAASRRGRYYDLLYQFSSSVGTVTAHIVHRVGSARPAFLITTGPTGPTGQSGVIHVGDDTPTVPLGGYSAAGHAQGSMLGSAGWTIAVTNNVAATLDGTLYAVRRGF